MENIINNVLDFIIVQLPQMFFKFYDILFVPYAEVLEDIGFNVPQGLVDILGDISLVGMFSVSFIFIVLTFKLIALFIPN